MSALGEKQDVFDWFEAGHTIGELHELGERAPDAEQWLAEQQQGDNEGLEEGVSGVRVGDFRAIMPLHAYMYMPTREIWPAASVNVRIASIDSEKASVWLDKNRAVEQVTWAPGEPELIRGRLVADGGWIEQAGVNCLNLYHPPEITGGDATQALRWLAHVRRVYPADSEHICNWLAHRVQRPGEKVNHALLLGGPQGIGKDTILEPVKYAVGPRNFAEISPAQMMGRFNGFVKSVVLRVSEARDLGDTNRFAFYDHSKSYIASPPNVLRCDEKNLREHAVMNVCGVIITTNHKLDGIYLPADDRRHYVAWSESSRDDFPPGYWTGLYRWYADGGFAHVAAYLAARDLSAFDCKAPPPKTPAFWSIVDANRAPEDAELSDALDALGTHNTSTGEIDWPDAITVSRIADAAQGDFKLWLRDRRNHRQIPHRLESIGYVAVRNQSTSDGRWRLDGKKQVVYARAAMSVRNRFVAVEKLVRTGVVRCTIPAAVDEPQRVGDAGETP